MSRELLRSERRRVTLLIAVLACLLILLFAGCYAPQIATPEMRARLDPAIRPFGLLLFAYLVYEAIVRGWLSRLIESDRRLPQGIQYLNVFLEVSLPSIGLAIGASFMDPLSVLAGTVPFLYFPFIMLAALNLNHRLCIFAGVVAALQFGVISLLMIGEAGAAPVSDAQPVLAMLTSPHQYVMKAVLFLVGGLIAGFVSHQIRLQMTRVVETLEERDRAVSIFGQHVSPQVADLLLKQPVDFTGQERNVCVMFLDIRDFSKLSSERSASEVVEYLNVLFAPIIPIVNEHSGIVNKFLGDGFMAVFGAPVDDGQQCAHAIRASLEILQQVETLNRQGAIPHTRLGIGLHVGRAVTGNVGSSQRKEYTIIGDVVNLASRIEQANKLKESQLLVSEAVVRAVGADSRFSAEDVGMVELKGQPQPVRLFKLA